jgi:hypothetical protein
VAELAHDAALLVAPGDAGAAAAALARLAAAAALRERLVVAGISRARAHTIEVESLRVARFLRHDHVPDDRPLAMAAHGR